MLSGESVRCGQAHSASPGNSAGNGGGAAPRKRCSQLRRLWQALTCWTCSAPRVRTPARRLTASWRMPASQLRQLRQQQSEGLRFHDASPIPGSASLERGQLEKFHDCCRQRLCFSGLAVPGGRPALCGNRARRQRYPPVALGFVKRVPQRYAVAVGYAKLAMRHIIARLPIRQL